MQKSHGIGYAEYGRKLDKRIQVEKRRERDYAQSRKVLANFVSSPHS